MAIVRRLRLRDFRVYAGADVELGAGLTVVHGANGAGKTNLLEGLYFACTGRSCRTTNEREVVRFGASAARVEADVEAGDGLHRLAVGYAPGEPKRLSADGAVCERLLDVPFRPLVTVFLPDRLQLVKGPPALRRAHLDQLVTGLWPARAAARRGYAQSLAQRNALLPRVRSGAVTRSAMATWDLEVGRHAVAIRADRERAVALVDGDTTTIAGELGLAGPVELRYRPRSRAESPEEFAAELADRLDSDLERGFTGHGPHRDDLALIRAARDLRVYGSQGEQRLGLLALLLAERAALGRERGATPLLLLDDVMSELDLDRRTRLIERVTASGQVVVTTTDLGHVPGAAAPGVRRLAVDGGVVREELRAA
jgi:DNA replication and repair protein RecF